jgi:hypothetical protein
MSASKVDAAGARFQAAGPERSKTRACLSAADRHCTDVTGESGGIPKSARVAQLCDQAGGSPRADAIFGGEEFSNFMLLKLEFDMLVQLLHSISQDFHVLACVFDLQLISLRVMSSLRDLGRLD